MEYLLAIKARAEVGEMLWGKLPTNVAKVLCAMFLFVPKDMTLAADNIAAIDLSGLCGITTCLFYSIFLGFLMSIMPGEVPSAWAMCMEKGKSEGQGGMCSSLMTSWHREGSWVLNRRPDGEMRDCISGYTVIRVEDGWFRGAFIQLRDSDGDGVKSRGGIVQPIALMFIFFVEAIYFGVCQLCDIRDIFWAFRARLRKEGGQSSVIDSTLDDCNKMKPGFVNLKHVVWHEAFLKLLELVVQYSKSGYSHNYHDSHQFMTF